MIATSSAWFVLLNQLGNINLIKYIVDGSNRVVSGYHLNQIRRKKESLILMSAFKYYG